MNPSLQAYLLQCIDHDAVTVDQALLPPFNPPPLRFADDRSDKAIIEDLRRQLEAVTAERDKVEVALQKQVNAHAQTKQDLRDVGERLNMADATINSLRDLLQAVTAERDKENRDHVAWVLAKDDQINKLTAERDALTTYRNDLHHNLMREKMLTERLRVDLAVVSAERDRYRTALETINTGMIGDWTPAGIAGQALEGGE